MISKSIHMGEQTVSYLGIYSSVVVIGASISIGIFLVYSYNSFMRGVME